MALWCEISPCAALSRNDRGGRTLEMTKGERLCHLDQTAFVISTVVEISQHLPQYGIKSSRSLFFVSIRASFFGRDHFFSCFSRAMAWSMSEYSSK